MSCHIRRSLIACCIIFFATLQYAVAQSAAALRLPRLFQDGMVVQRDVSFAVWGWAAGGATVSVTLAGRTGRAVADKTTGEWRVRFPALRAGGPHTLAVTSGDAQLSIQDVMAGDVWVASGQSNMEWPLAAARNGAAATADARDRLIREFAVPHAWSDTPQSDVEGGRWVSADPEHAGRFSAIAYFFARDLRAATGVPIGIIHSSWGGSNIETWMSRASLGISDSAWQALMQQNQAQESAIRDALLARIGALPAKDRGLVDERAIWADPALADSGWATLPVPSLWEDAGFAGLDGSAWYRTSFSLTEAEAQRDARISLGMIDDDDITWVNGVEVGRTQGYSTRRIYVAPASLLRAGNNVLAVRVMDGGGGGGPYGASEHFYIEVDSARRPLGGSWKFKVGAVSLRADGQRINKIPTILYNQMLHPLLRYPIKGVIWYQGESNANNDEQAAAYRQQFAQLIRSWRAEWSGTAAEFPFFWVQLPNYGPVDTVPPARAVWATLRESQTAALDLPNTGQVVTIDVGDPRDLHPRDKELVGQRLARVARRVAYGETKLLASGPVYRGHTVRAGHIEIEFDNVGSGLVSRSGENVGGFAIAGADRVWTWADARIDGNRVVVSSSRVPQPVAVRYAWSDSPKVVGLYNREGLPAAPFRTGTPTSAAPAAWVGTWGTAPQLVEPANLPPAPGLAGNTLRQIVRVSVGGNQLRVRFSNAYGATPVTLNSVHIAGSAGGSAIDPATDHALTFSGQRGVTIPPRRATVSDAFAFPLQPLSKVAITIHFGTTSTDITGHPGSRTTSYLQPGEATAAVGLPDAVETVHWYILTGVDVATEDSGAAVVVLGNSITDGRGSGTDLHNRWPDELAIRLHANQPTAKVAVINQGIGGNCVLRDCLGPSALSRFDRDVLGQSAVRWLIILEGVNDIGQAAGAEASAAVARGLIAAYRQMIGKARAQSIKVYGATIMPFGESFYDHPEREAARQTVNEWIRTSGAFDGVIDTDAALRDPERPTHLLPAADTGDHLHPNELGHKLIARAVDLGLFAR